MMGPPIATEPALLVVRGASAGTIDVTAHIDGEPIRQSMIGGKYEEVKTEVLPQLNAEFFSRESRPQTGERVARELVLAILPSRVRSAISSWSSSQGGHGVLVVDAEDPYDSLPWELLPAFFGDGVFVVRTTENTGAGAAQAPGLPVPVEVLAAGWQQSAPGYLVPGVIDEVQSLSRRFPPSIEGSDLYVRTDIDTDWGETAAAIRDDQISTVHLAVAGGFYAPPGENPSLILFGDDSDDRDPTVTVDQIIESLRDADDLRLMILNTMTTPIGPDTSALRQIASELGVAVVGWAGMLDDEVAIDFAEYWYQRAIEGMTLPEISHSFVSRSGGAQWVRGSLPVVLIPSSPWLEEPVINIDRTRTYQDSINQKVQFDLPTGYATKHAPPKELIDDPVEAPRDGAPLHPDADSSESPVETDGSEPPAASPQIAPPQTAPPQIAPPQVSLTWTVRSSIFPAQLVNGRSPITKLNVESDRDFNGRIEVECDIGGTKSTVRRLLRFTTGSNSLISERLTYDFPAIYELIRSDDRRVVAFTVSVYERELVAQETFHATWLSRRDWLNDDAGWPFVSAYVLSMSGAVADLVNKAQEILSQIGRPGDRFEGYPKNAADGEKVGVQMRAVFQAVRSLGVQYITPPGLPAAVFNPIRMNPEDIEDEELTMEPVDSNIQASQIVRTPQDILDRSHGTCHDLSLLFAAAAEYVGIYPLVILMSGHTYFGYWTNPDAYHEYWRDPPQRPQGTEPWTISQPSLKKLVGDGAVKVLEANMAAHPQASIEQAERSARRYIADPSNRVVDVQRSRRSGVQPVTLL